MVETRSWIRLSGLIFLIVVLCSIYCHADNSTYALSYDSAGNQIQGVSNYYEYDSLNQLIRVRAYNSTGRILEEYLYDDTGNRIRKVETNISGQNQTTYYLSRYFMQVVNSSGTYNYTYVWLDDKLVARKNPDGSTWYYHPDHLGSTNLITNSTGGVVEETSYMPYGQVLAGGTKEDFLYTGKEKDSSGLYYYGARYYDPSIMRFTTADAKQPNVYDPQQPNRYSYARNNPYKYIDPSGNDAVIASTYQPLKHNIVTGRSGHEVIIIGNDDEGYTLFSFTPNSQTKRNFNPEPIAGKTVKETEDIYNAIQSEVNPDEPQLSEFGTFHTSKDQDHTLLAAAELNGKKQYSQDNYDCQGYTIDTLNSVAPYEFSEARLLGKSITNERNHAEWHKNHVSQAASEWNKQQASSSAGTTKSYTIWEIFSTSSLIS